MHTPTTEHYHTLNNGQPPVTPKYLSNRPCSRDYNLQLLKMQSKLQPKVKLLHEPGNYSKRYVYISIIKVSLLKYCYKRYFVKIEYSVKVSFKYKKEKFSYSTALI